jgi:chromosome segregation ATPase
MIVKLRERQPAARPAGGGTGRLAPRRDRRRPGDAPRWPARAPVRRTEAGPPFRRRCIAMPTSKDILKDAQKTYEDNRTAKRALEDIAKTAQQDIGEFGKAKSSLAGSIQSMKTMLENIEERSKKLNDTLTELKKNAAVMQAPADKKAYDRLVKEISEEIKSVMSASKELSGLMKTAQSEWKR